jgi:hypothetical protein
MLSCYKNKNNTDDTNNINNINNINTCSICLEDMNKSNYKLKCSHEYHKNCIDGWLKNNATCPICRTHIVIDIPKLPINKIDIQRTPTINVTNNITTNNLKFKKYLSLIFFILSIMFYVGSSIYNIYQFEYVNNHINNYIKDINETQLGNHSNSTYEAGVLIGVDIGYYFLFIICCVQIFHKNSPPCCSKSCSVFTIGILIIANLIIRFEFFSITNKFLQEKYFNFDLSYYDKLSLSLILYGCSYGCKIVGMMGYSNYIHE